MAASGSNGRTIQSTSDETFEFLCSPCKMKNRTREAMLYCVDCVDYYCSTCVEFHGDIPALKCHKILGKSDFPTAASRNLTIVPTDRCPLHPTKLLDMFCQNDDEIGCHACMAVKHRSCIDVFYIPEEIDNIFKEAGVSRVKADLSKATACLTDLVKTRQNDLSQVNKNRVVALDKIKNYRQKLNTALDGLEKSTIDKFESKMKNLNDEIQKAIATMNIAVKDLEECHQHIDSTEENRPQQFVCMKKGQKKLSETEKLSRDFEKSSRIVKLDFEEDPTIETCLSKLNSLGKLLEESNSNLHQVAKQTVPYKVTNKNTYNVKMSGDKSNCYIWRSCIMTSGNILLTDWDNKQLKQLHGTTYKVIDQCDLPGCPRAVCEIGPQEAAVTLDNTIQVVSTGSKMTPTRTIQMNHYCYGLAFSRGEMFVSDSRSHVYVHDTSGTLLRTISKDQSGGDIFSHSRHIAISDDGNSVYVADNKKGVVTLDRQGRVLSWFTDPELSGACGVCTDGCGSVLVCGYGSRNVIQIGPSGNKLGVIADMSHGISCPQSVCYDRSHSRMIVTNDSNNITVLDLVTTSK